MLTFLHLSDIHFRKWSGSQYDTDSDVRNELLIDAKAFAQISGKTDGILITGDIAFSGRKEEYENAKEFLRHLCAQVGATFAEIWCIPGNHDVDQTLAKESGTFAAVQQQLRDTATSAPHTLDGEISKLINDPVARGPLYQPLEQYNSFAASFNCSISAEKPHWQHYLELDDGSQLRLNGLNSTIVSNHLDNTARFVVLGRHQVPIRTEGVVDLIMCHHPHDWLRDDDSVKNTLDDRVTIQLFGHKHRQTTSKREKTLHLVAGAVHPDRRETSWSPRYNWITVKIENNGNYRLAVVEAFPRLWNENTGKFAADYNSCEGMASQTHRFALPAWTPPTVPKATSNVTTSHTVGTASGPSIMDPVRTLTYRFFDLPHLQRMDILADLGLLSDDDEGLKDSEIYHRAFKRASDAKSLASFWDAVERKHNDGKFTVNPFQTK